VRSWLILEWSGGAAAQHDVPSIGEGPLRNGRLGIELRHEAVAAGLIRDRLQDRIARHQRVAREVHLGHEPAAKLAAEEREMDVRGAPRVAMVLPGIRARRGGYDALVSFVVRQGAARN